MVPFLPPNVISGTAPAQSASRISRHLSHLGT
jgi:hypothetical protein